MAQMVASVLTSLTKEIGEGSSDKLEAWLRIAGRFRRYSTGNMLLIASQMPTAAYLRGFMAWKQLGRSVKRGAKGIRIQAPVLRVMSRDGTEQERVVAFRAAYVWDVSQTEGQPFVDLERAKGDPGEYSSRLVRWAASQGIKIQWAEHMAGLSGISRGGVVILKSSLEVAEAFSTLAHELGHELLHHRGDIKDVPKAVIETEAEAVAFAVCHAAGVDTLKASRNYIHLCNGSQEMLLGSLKRIQETAINIIEGILTDPDEIAAPVSEPTIMADEARAA
jgi:hypothetical protein